MDGKKIYLDNIPMYEEYDLIDLHEEDTLFLMKMYEKENKNKTSNGTRIPNEMFIIGRKIQNNNNSISAEQFFKDYLNLGKDIFNLSTYKHDIEFQYPYELDDDYTYLKHIANDIDYEMEMRKKYNSDLDEIYTIKEEASAYLEDTVFERSLGIFQDLTDKILNLVYVLHAVFNQEVKKEIEKLINVMSRIFECCLSVDTDSSIETFIRLKSINKDLKVLLNTIKNEMKNKKLDIRKKTITSNAKKIDSIMNIDFINKTNDYPIRIKFTYSQFKDLKKIIKSWLKKYGFPYYVNVDDVESYKVEIKKIIPLKDDEMAVPCDLLIIHSVYNYMFYSILTKGNKADEKIKEKFIFSDNKNNRLNKKNIFTIKNLFSYFNKVIVSNILNFRSNKIVNDRLTKEEFQKSDNYFKEKTDEFIYEEVIFNNLCVAFNGLLDDETRYISPKNKDKKCPTCDKWFTPNRHFRTYCSEKCRKNGNRKRWRENKRKQRKNI